MAFSTGTGHQGERLLGGSIEEKWGYGWNSFPRGSCLQPQLSASEGTGQDIASSAQASGPTRPALGSSTVAPIPAETTALLPLSQGFWGSHQCWLPFPRPSQRSFQNSVPTKLLEIDGVKRSFHGLIDWLPLSCSSTCFWRGGGQPRLVPGRWLSPRPGPSTSAPATTQHPFHLGNFVTFLSAGGSSRENRGGGGRPAGAGGYSVAEPVRFRRTREGALWGLDALVGVTLPHRGGPFSRQKLRAHQSLPCSAGMGVLVAPVGFPARRRVQRHSQCQDSLLIHSCGWQH